ncbi:acetylornithine/succinylornithine family transaminase [Seongchinamella sediminis]|uniref:Acetylornithine aminotransferase n=1 Tax=Seongchinamella sediminis TaxID=2283635 RepID=A0A3L7DUH8_9GAMM|nr:aspartate aminotransferase family protein [Seongchinamella sediminis]RLQ21237.1 acetylornithine/succinylornithine family transaminase [Seongchinamella sediminis]
MSALMPTYARLPVTFSHGEGVYLFDTEGRRYLDGLSGIAVTGLGHAHPGVTAAIRDQADKLVHASNLYGIGPQEQLAERLAGVTGMEKCFFGNSGAEANEAAIKLARLYGHSRGVEKPAIIVLEGAFHGRTLATLSATGNRKIQAGFEPLVSGFVRAPGNDIEAIHHIAANNPDVVAFLAEPIQGEGGVNELDPGYLQAVRAICDEQGWLMMLDEVQTGNGRTGNWFAYQDMNFSPDVLTTAKGLGNGVPIGACMARGEAATVFGPGHHGSTYGGNPLVCAAALAVIDAIEAQQLLGHAAQMGKLIRTTIETQVGDSGPLVASRGRGLMLGFQLDRDCPELVQRALDAGLLINVTAGNTIRLLPPLVINESQATELATGVARLIGDL